MRVTEMDDPRRRITTYTAVETFEQGAQVAKAEIQVTWEILEDAQFDMKKYIHDQLRTALDEKIGQWEAETVYDEEVRRCEAEAEFLGGDWNLPPTPNWNDNWKNEWNDNWKNGFIREPLQQLVTQHYDTGGNGNYNINIT